MVGFENFSYDRAAGAYAAAYEEPEPEEEYPNHFSARVGTDKSVINYRMLDLDPELRRQVERVLDEDGYLLVPNGTCSIEGDEFFNGRRYATWWEETNTNIRDDNAIFRRRKRPRMTADLTQITPEQMVAIQETALKLVPTLERVGLRTTADLVGELYTKLWQKIQNEPHHPAYAYLQALRVKRWNRLRFLHLDRLLEKAIMEQKESDPHHVEDTLINEVYIHLGKMQCQIADQSNLANEAERLAINTQKEMEHING